MAARCAPLPYLRLITFDRAYYGITPSAAGNGPRYIVLKATRPYVIVPEKRVWALFGSDKHEKLAKLGLTYNVLSEQKLSDAQLKGIADLLEEDEWRQGLYILTDYKTSGSYKTCQWLGIKVEKWEEPITKNGEPVLLKSGPNKGKPKMKKHSRVVKDPKKAQKRELDLQINRYRMLYESHGFPIHKMRAFVTPRDGGLYIAKQRGLDRSMLFVPIPRLDDNYVMHYYAELKAEVDPVVATATDRACDYVRPCNAWENWDGRRCREYCEVSSYCVEMCEEYREKWPGD